MVRTVSLAEHSSLSHAARKHTKRMPRLVEFIILPLFLPLCPQPRIVLLMFMMGHMYLYLILPGNTFTDLLKGVLTKLDVYQSW